MNKKIICIVMIFTFISFMSMASSENFDAGQYSLEELREISTKVDDRISELEAEWAIEHGDRIISFEEPEITLFTKKVQKLKPQITRVVEDAPEKTSLLWSSSDETIAKVSSDGTVTAVAKGDATIIATAKDNEYIFGSIIIHVVLPVSKVHINEEDITLLLNDRPENAEADLHATIEPEDAYCNDITWNTSKEDIVRVDDNGHIKGLAPGKATITAKSAEEGSEKKAKINVTVLQAVREINLSDKELVIDLGKTAKLKAEVLPEDASSKKVEWTSGNEEIAKVSSEGTITAKSCGQCDIMCTAKDGSAVSSICHVIVKQLVKGLKLSESKITLPSGESMMIETIITPEDATEKEVKWESSDASIAKVSDDGRITAENGGDCEITCTAQDGSEKQATVSVHVPAFSVDNDTCLIDTITACEIPIKLIGITAEDIVIDSPSSIVTAEINNDGIIRLFPVNAGKGNLKISCTNNNTDKASIAVEVTHNAISDLQDMLINLGTYSAGLTGTVDSKTKAAINSAQEMLGFQVDGTVTEAFFNSLKEALVLEPKSFDGSKALNEVFPDEALAMAVRNSMGLMSITQSVTQADLDECTSLTISDGPVTSLAGVEYLRNLTKFDANCMAGWHIAYRDTCGPCKSAALTANSIRQLMACKNLEYISIHGSPFSRIPHEIGDLKKLETFDIEYGCFTSLPDEICKCTNLKVLAIEKTPLKVLPENIGNLENLTDLRVQYARITELPESIGDLAQLTSLRCDYSDLTTLPDSIGSLTNLSEINLSGNIYLESLPESMENLVSLTTLNLNSCKKMTSLPSGLQGILMSNNAKVDLEKTSIK